MGTDKHLQNLSVINMNIFCFSFSLLFLYDFATLSFDFTNYIFFLFRNCKYISWAFSDFIFSKRSQWFHVFWIRNIIAFLKTQQNLKNKTKQNWGYVFMCIFIYRRQQRAHSFKEQMHVQEKKGEFRQLRMAIILQWYIDFHF